MLQIFQLIKEANLKKNIFLSFFLSFFLFSIFAKANYKQNYIPNFTSVIEIELSKKNLKTFYKYLSSINYNKVKSRNEKKWINANIIFNSKIIKGKIRINGSPTTMDHIDFTRGISSLHVKLLNGDIDGITKFRLLLPRTKGYENEIFWSLMMESLNFPTPHTQFSKVKLNKSTFNMIFQEKAEKEFLNRWQIGSSPILEGNTSYWMSQQVKCMKLISKNFEDCFNESTSDILQTLKIENNNFLKKTNLKLAYDAILSNSIYENKKFININKGFADHGLSFKNSKYFYDDYYRFRSNIYFDGDVHFRNYNLNNCANLTENAFIRKFLVNFSQTFKQRSGLTLSKKLSCFLKYKLQDPNIFFKKMTIDDVVLDSHKQKKITNTKNIEYLIFSSKDQKFHKCMVTFYCEPIGNKMAKLFLTGSHKLYKNSEFQKLVLDSEKNKEKQIFAKKIINNNYDDLNIPKNTTLYISIEKNIKKIKINLESSLTSKLIIMGTIPNNLNLEINIKKKIIDKKEFYSRPKECVSFVDAKFKLISINYMNSYCDHPIKFIRSEGEVKINNFADLYKNENFIKFSKIKFIN